MLTLQKLIIGFVFSFGLLVGNMAPLLAVNFDSQASFPGWKDGDSKVRGVIGINATPEEGLKGDHPDTLKSGETKMLLYFLPTVIDLIFKIVAPIVVVMFIFSGLRFIYASGDEEELKRAKDFLLYGLIGIAFIALSYSLMKIVYFLL